jgi:small subunit ribosomal protein S2
MQEISLKGLLEAGCHFGHRVEKWHPKSAKYIFEPRQGIHIIDLVKTKSALAKAANFVKTGAQEGKILLIVATKRQAKGVCAEAAKRGSLPYFTNRWIGGFVTNWDEVKKNIDKLNKFRKEKAEGAWQKFPKHEMVKLDKHLTQLEMVYSGVSALTHVPEMIFIVDIKKEINCLYEAVRRKIPVVAIVDTNADPNRVEYPIPANDDAVGSIAFVTNYIVDAYIEGKNLHDKEIIKEEELKNAAGGQPKGVEKTDEAKVNIPKTQEKSSEAKVNIPKVQEKTEEVKKEVLVNKVKKVEEKKVTKKVEKAKPVQDNKEETVKKKRGRPKKSL